MARKKALKHTSRTQQLLDLVPAYELAGNPWPSPLTDVAKWAIKEGLWAPKPLDPVKILRKELARALRVDTFVDPQGRRVRKYHPYVISGQKDGEAVQLVMWDDIAKIPPNRMQASLQLRRDGIRNDCWQLEMDRESYNENHNPGQDIQLSLDFGEDIEEMKQSAIPMDFDLDVLDEEFED